MFAELFMLFFLGHLDYPDEITFDNDKLSYRGRVTSSFRDNVVKGVVKKLENN